MKEFLTDKINNLPASATLAMAAKARELKNKGIDIIGLSLGEPDFNVPHSKITIDDLIYNCPDKSRVVRHFMDVQA